MIHYDYKHYSPEWWEIRRYIPTASSFSRIFNNKMGKLSKGSDDYACELLAAKYTPPPTDFYEYMSKDMAHGLEFEPEARAYYSLLTDDEVKLVGFYTTDCGRFGASPDSSVGLDGGLEIKCPMAKTHIGYLLDGVLPDDYKTQVHGQLIVTGWKWIDFISYRRGLPPLKVRVFPDEYTDLLRGALEQFWLRYKEIEQIIEGLREVA